MHGLWLAGSKCVDSNPSTPLTPDAFGRVRIVLVRPSHPGNIGAAARAMKTMGFARLVLVAPKALPDAQAEAMASGATDVLAAAETVATLPAALAGVTLALALTSRRRDLATAPLWAREGAAELARLAVTGSEVALVFGNETYGLTTEEANKCRMIATIPANPEYSSLNLAAAVQVFAYELRMAAGAAMPRGKPRTMASHEEIEGFYAHLEQTMVEAGFFDPGHPKKLMPRLRRLFARAQLEKEEVNILRGLLKALDQPKKRDKP
jgi:tRNA/rRNA methyltransferase